MGKTKAVATWATAAEMLAQLGVGPERVCLSPLPGTATEKDLLRKLAVEDKLYELVDGTLVEKAMGYGEGGLAADIIRLVGRYLDANDIGDLGGADSTMRLMPGLVRIPDVSFVNWNKLPNRQRPTEPIPDLVPDLAIEVLSESNTPAEMSRKVKEYFFTGVRAVWLVDWRARTVAVYADLDQFTTYGEDDTLDGGDVLPGLKLPVRDVFARMPSPPAKPTRKKRK